LFCFCVLATKALAEQAFKAVSQFEYKRLMVLSDAIAQHPHRAVSNRQLEEAHVERLMSNFVQSRNPNNKVYWVGWLKDLAEPTVDSLHASQICLSDEDLQLLTPPKFVAPEALKEFQKIWASRGFNNGDGDKMSFTNLPKETQKELQVFIRRCMQNGSMPFEAFVGLHTSNAIYRLHEKEPTDELWSTMFLSSLVFLKWNEQGRSSIGLLGALENKHAGTHRKNSFGDSMKSLHDQGYYELGRKTRTQVEEQQFMSAWKAKFAAAHGLNVRTVGHWWTYVASHTGKIWDCWCSLLTPGALRSDSDKAVVEAVTDLHYVRMHDGLLQDMQGVCQEIKDAKKASEVPRIFKAWIARNKLRCCKDDMQNQVLKVADTMGIFSIQGHLVEENWEGLVGAVPELSSEKGQRFLDRLAEVNVKIGVKQRSIDPQTEKWFQDCFMAAIHRIKNPASAALVLPSQQVNIFLNNLETTPICSRANIHICVADRRVRLRSWQCPCRRG